MKVAKWIIFLFAALFFTSCARTSIERGNNIEVFGVGNVSFEPNIVFLNIAISFTEREMNPAILKIEDANKYLYDILKKYNIDEMNINKSIIETQRIYVEKEFTSYYLSSQIIIITINNIDKVENIMKEIAFNEGINISRIQYSNTNIINYEIEAELIALKNAKTIAEKIAENTGIKLGKINYVRVSIWDNDRLSLYDGPSSEWNKTITRTVTVGYEIK